MPISKKRLARAIRRYENFTGLEAGKARPMFIPDPPDVVAVLGEVVSIVYKTKKRDTSGRAVEYIHKFKKRPSLLTNDAGTALFIAGGRIRVTARGITG